MSCLLLKSFEDGLPRLRLKIFPQADVDFRGSESIMG
jgi:hypothetical protein